MKKPYMSIESNGTVWSDDAPICPYCHKAQNDLFEVAGAYTEAGGQPSCQKCGKDFDLSTFIEYSWTTRKIP